MTGGSKGTGVQAGRGGGALGGLFWWRPLLSSGERTGPEAWEGDTRRLSEGDLPSTTQRKGGEKGCFLPGRPCVPALVQLLLRVRPAV